MGISTSRPRNNGSRTRGETRHSTEQIGVVPAPLGVDLDSFDYIHHTDFGMMAIGKGGFGLVSVMKLMDPKHRAAAMELTKTGENDQDILFAVKSMSKHKLILKEMVENTLNELEILTSLSRHHNNIVNCHYAFQDTQSLYIVLDLCLGGSVAHALHKAGKFPLSRAKHYVAELIVGLRFLHSERIVHRDIKPDNVLIDLHGRIRITDFNVSFKVPVEGEHSLQHRDGWGTRGYRAPEIYLRQGGGGMLFACDWWSCGAMFYEMLAGTVPFTVTDVPEGAPPAETPLTLMLRRVQAKEFDLDKIGAEEDLRDFARRLLEYDPTKRLGDSTVTEHAFLRSIDFDKLERGEIRPPWLPAEEVAAREVTAMSSSSLTAAQQQELLQQAKRKPLNLALFAKNFDVKVDERERLRALNSNLMAAGLYDDDDDDEEQEHEQELTVEQQSMFAEWSFNVHVPKPLRVEDYHLPVYGLLQSVSALQTAEAAREFINQVDNRTLNALLQEMKRVHEDLLLENAKFMQAEMRCDELSRELAQYKTHDFAHKRHNAAAQRVSGEGVKPKLDAEEEADLAFVGNLIEAGIRREEEEARSRTPSSTLLQVVVEENARHTSNIDAVVIVVSSNDEELVDIANEDEPEKQADEINVNEDEPEKQADEINVNEDEPQEQEKVTDEPHEQFDEVNQVESLQQVVVAIVESADDESNAEDDNFTEAASDQVLKPTNAQLTAEQIKANRKTRRQRASGAFEATV